jgi:chemotaxis protein CheX
MANVKFMNPFVEAATEVIKAEVGSEVRRGTLSLQKTAVTSDDITVLISLVGQVNGVVLYGMSIETGLAMVSRITGQDFSDFDNLAQSGVAEMGNVITGRATIKLSEAGYNSNISPPTLITGRGVQISTLDFSRIMVPIITDFGEILVHLAIRETPPGSTPQSFVPLSVH